MNEKHPDEAKMVLPVTSEACQACHSITFGEWRVSLHGQKNIRCFDCHKMHGMALRKDDPDQMCGTCHTERLKDFSHATHHIKGVQCIHCHMPETVGAHLKIKGTGTRGHSFGVGAETCANCHREMVHASHERTSLQEEVEQLKAQTPDKLLAQLDELKRDNAALRDTVRANRRVFPIIAVAAFLLGMAIEFALLYRRRKKHEKEAKPR
jgi:predicted CXXCH cytochrome family protein